MRDPLSQVRIRYKLPLGFLAICLVAFGIGGVVLTREANAALEEQIQRRLDERAGALEVVVERHLDLHRRRAEDFASDGFIRSQLERLVAEEAAGRTAEAGTVRAGLERHLAVNKLPLVKAFVGAVLYAADGTPRVRSPREAVGFDANGDVRETTTSPLVGAMGNHPYPTFRISTPLKRLTDDEGIGVLQIVLRADTWIQGMEELGTLPQMELAVMRLHGQSFALQLPNGASVGAPVAPRAEEIGYKRGVTGTDWFLELGVDRALAMRPAVRLRNQYILIGLGLLLVTAGVMFFPVRFLLAPLSSIAETARRLGAGEFEARVEHDSSDEIGDLARAFNFMAQAVEDRTQQLEEAAGTLRKREQDIRLERDRLDAVIRSMEDGLFILDADGQVTLSNAAAKPIVEALEAPRGASRRLECLHLDEASLRCLACLANVQGGQQACVFERDGRIYEIHATSLPAAPGTRPSRLCVSRDVTTRLNAQESQAHQERMTVLGEIAAVMAHELNNPLAAISMFSQMMSKEAEPGSTLSESADVIRRNVQTCKQTISGLLDLAARGALTTARMDVHALLEDVARFVRPIFDRAGVTLRVDAEASDPTLVGDQVQLRQVFMNLLMNAVQACKSGGRVTASTSGAETSLEVRVADDGGGIPEDVKARIFEPFFTTKGAGVGTGLGLPTSRRIVEEHGGKLTLVSTGPSGTVFEITLPRQAHRAKWRAEARMSAPVAGTTAEPGKGAERS